MAEVLLVEDDELLRDLYTEALASENIKLTTVANGTTALSLAMSKMWDLILLDVYLPELSGIDIAKTLREQHPELHSPIVFLTNSDDPQILNQITALGCTYLIKSDMTPDVFSEKVAQFLSEKENS